MYTKRTLLVPSLALAWAAACAFEPRQSFEAPPRVAAPVESASAISEAAAPEDVQPQPEPARLQAGESLLGVAVEDADGLWVGTIEDVLFEPSTGKIFGLVASIALPEGRTLTRILEYASVAWTSEGPVFALGCPRSELARSDDHAGVFYGQGSSVVAGEITDIESLHARATRAVILKIRDQGNILHRVLVEPAELVARTFAPLNLGQNVQAEGVLTRDSTGKLLVASVLAQDGKRLSLRDSSGAIAWETLLRDLPSAREVDDRIIRSKDGSSLNVRGLVLDRVLGAIVSVHVVVEGVERVLPWAEVERGAGGVWTVALDQASLSALPAASLAGERVDP